MKTANKFFIGLMAVALAVTGCSKDDPGNGGGDPGDKTGNYPDGSLVVQIQTEDIKSRGLIDALIVSIR